MKRFSDTWCLVSTRVCDWCGVSCSFRCKCRIHTTSSCYHTHNNCVIRHSCKPVWFYAFMCDKVIAICKVPRQNAHVRNTVPAYSVKPKRKRSVFTLPHLQHFISGNFWRLRIPPEWCLTFTPFMHIGEFSPSSIKSLRSHQLTGWFERGVIKRTVETYVTHWIFRFAPHLSSLRCFVCKSCKLIYTLFIILAVATWMIKNFAFELTT